MTTPIEDDFTELVDADIPRVDLVDKAANGMRFLIAKQADGATGLMNPDLIRDLLAKSEPEPTSEETVTMTGTPGALANLIHEAAVRQVAKAGDKKPEPKYRGLTQEAKDKYVADLKDSSKNPTHDIAAGIRRMSEYAASGNLPHGITYDELKWMYNQAAAELHRRDPDSDAGGNFPALGSGVHKSEETTDVAKCQAMQAAFRSAGQEVGDDVEKAEDDTPVDEGVDGLDPTVPLAAPDEQAPGDPTEPGSPAWEAIDAATARKWTSILVRAKNALGVLADRELIEAACGADPDDVKSAWDLRDAQCAIDCAINCLAGYAVDEQSEVDLANDAQTVAKALDGFDPTALDTLEVLAPVRKAGRTLSAANELAIRQAVESLTKVLASLPQPQPDEADQPVAKKEETMLVDPTTTEETTDAAAVEKAAGEPTPLVPVYDAAGRLVGVVDPGNLTPVVCPDKGDDMGDEDMPTDTTDADGEAAVGDEVAAAEQEMADMEPAPPASVGTPADAVHDDDVAKTTEPNETDTTTSDAEPQSSIADLVKAELDARSATQEEVIAKQAATLTEMAKTIETLNARIHTLEEQPAEPKVFTNGAVPPNIALRGQDRGAAQQIDMAKAQEMRKGLYSATHASEQNRIAQDMQGLAIVALEDIHNRRVPQ